MANTYFQFKQFRIEQANTAMKVCTDSCILGAYASYLAPGTILDIGTGTGLLSLMLAQRFTCHIDAVEIEEKAAEQAKENVNRSPWNARINVYQNSIQKFSETTGEKYDLIVSNPPFFANHLKSERENKNLAMHSEELNYKELATAVTRLLNPLGRLFVLTPVYEGILLDENCKAAGLLPETKLELFTKEDEPKPFRVISSYSFSKQELKQTQLFIKKETNEYTNQFKDLLKEYYLQF